MAGTGLKPEHYPEPHVELWPENGPPIDLFHRYNSQWRVGTGGAIGLDYGPILHDLDRRNLSPDDYDKTLAAIRVIESAALDEMHKD